MLVALSGGPEGDTLIRRAKRTASRGAGGEFLAVHVQRSDGLSTASPKLLARQQALVEELGGAFHTMTGDDTAGAVLDLARQVNATQIVIGATRRSRLKELFSRGVGETIIEGSGDDIDVYVVTHSEAPTADFCTAAQDPPKTRALQSSPWDVDGERGRQVGA